MTWALILGQLGTFLKKYWWVIPIAIFFITVLTWGKRLFVKIKTKIDISRAEASKVDGNNDEVINLSNIAYNIYDAFYGRAWGMFEDEKEAIEQLKRVPKSYVSQLAGFYSKFGKKTRNMYHDFRRFLTDKQYKEVEFLLV